MKKIIIAALIIFSVLSTGFIGTYDLNNRIFKKHKRFFEINKLRPSRNLLILKKIRKSIFSQNLQTDSFYLFESWSIFNTYIISMYITNTDTIAYAIFPFQPDKSKHFIKISNAEAVEIFSNEMNYVFKKIPYTIVTTEPPRIIVTKIKNNKIANCFILR